nr:hypothetical protein [Tanacetum cinerariifolium]
QRSKNKYAGDKNNDVGGKIGMEKASRGSRIKNKKLFLERYEHSRIDHMLPSSEQDPFSS